MNTIELSDFWSIKLSTQKYGELIFSRIIEEIPSVISSVKENPENLIKILWDSSFNCDRNKSIKKEVQFDEITSDEKKDFYQKFINLQFDNYEYDEKVSEYENFELAVQYWKKQIKEESKKIRDSYRKTMDMSLALSSNSFQQMSQILSSFVFNYQRQIQAALQPMTSLYKSIEQAIRIPSITFATNKYYSSLSNALAGLNKYQGIINIRIYDPLRSFREQMEETTRALQLPFERYQTALSYIPDNYSISRIFRDDYENVSIYVKDLENEDEPEYNIENTSVDRGFIDFLHDIPKDKVIKFVTHLQEYPYLALIDNVGKQIFEAVQTKIADYVVEESDKTFYRARAKKEGDVDWTPLQIGEPQYGIPGMGRYNFLGKPLFYVTTEIQTAKEEVQSEEYPESTVMKLGQNKEMKVFDISSEDCPLVSYCNMDKKSGNDYTAYLVPNFLSVCCSYLNKKNRHSVDAIKYKSNKADGGYCYVILDKSPLDFFEEGDIVSE